MGMQELLVILVVGLLLFGSNRLPAVAKQLGESARLFRRALDQDDHSAPRS